MRMILIAALALSGALAGSVPAFAEAPPPKVERRLTVYGNDVCPHAQGDEIVVCAREPESERYRIPKALRAKPREESGASASWASRVEGLEAAQRFTLPNGCSPVGANGQTGCTQAMIHQWYLERHMAKDLQDK